MSEGLMHRAATLHDRLLAGGFVEGSYEPEPPADDPALLPLAVLTEEEEEARERRDLWMEGHGG